MQSRNPFSDDLAKLLRSAAGVAQGAKEEFETLFSSMVDRWLAERSLVTREEFDALKKTVEDMKAAATIRKTKKKAK